MPLWSCLMPFGLPVRLDGVENTERASGALTVVYSVINAFCHSCLYSNSLAAILLPYTQRVIQGYWHLYSWANALSGWVG